MLKSIYFKKVGEKMKKIVVPGELLSEERKRLGSNVFVSDGKIYSKILGIVDDQSESANVVPLQGKYFPKEGDIVVGVVGQVMFSGYSVDINSFYTTFLPKSTVREPLAVGDVLKLNVDSVNELREAKVSFPKLLTGGELFNITSVRAPRLIGKNNSMFNLLKDGTKNELIIGKNGRIWARGGDISLLKKLIEFIDNNSYKNELTNAVESYLKEKN
jgi:exosome complex component RRP4